MGLTQKQLPLFPDFEPISLAHFDAYQKIMAEFPPYSDHYFTSAWGWDVDEEITLSSLNGNLVLRLSDYLTGEPVYTFIGQNDVLATMATLFEYLSQLKLPPHLSMVPEHVLRPIMEESKKKYHLTEDTDNFDYVCEVAQLKDYEGTGFSKVRNKWKKFTKMYGADLTTKVVPGTDKIGRQVVFDLCANWQKQTNRSNEEIAPEKKAIERFFKGAPQFDLEIQIIYYQDQPIGFNFFEVVKPNYAVLSFQKSNYDYHGINEFSHSLLCHYLSSKSVEFLSLEQDLGIAGLREAKQKYMAFYLKKFRLSAQEK